jgi:outer membrane protein assembly factor BamB
MVMSRTSGLALLACVALVIGSLFVPAHTASGDDPRAGPGADEPDKRRPRFSALIQLPSSDELEGKLDIAPTYLKAGDWATAAQVLQWVLDHPADAFVPVRFQGPGGKAMFEWASARSQADRLLATLPAKGREFYEVRYGPKAAELLTAARKARDREQLARVVARYRHTNAGRQAAELLGTYHLDRGHHHLAARYFRGLLARPDGDKLPALSLLKAYLALRRAGDEGAADAAWKRLAARAPDGLRFDGRVIPLARLKAELARVPSGHAQPGAAVVRGEVAGVARGWDHPTVGDGPAAEWLEGALARLATNGQPALPAASPLLVAGTLVYRSHRGVHAVEAATGRPLWDSPLRGSLEELADDPARLAHASGWASALVQGFPHALLENSTVGTLSADGRQVYAVEDLEIPVAPRNYGAFFSKSGAGLRFSFADDLTDAVYHSRLLAFDLESGLAVWEAGGRGAGKDRPLRDAHFLGPPLPLGGKLYALIEKEQALRLVCLDPADGRLCWSQTLAMPQRNVLLDGGRRTWAAHLAYADGVLVCPTNAGAVIGVDLATRNLLWAHSYREAPPPEPLPPGRGRFRRPWMATIQMQLDLAVKWKHCAPVIARDPLFNWGRVLLTAPDGATLDCLDLYTRALLWRVNRDEADLYLAGVFGESVLVVGRHQCTAYWLIGGKVRWRADTGEPCGLGVAAGNVYYLPVKKDARTGGPAVLGIDLEKGIVVSRTPLPGGELPGNLLLSGDRLISQTATRIAAYTRGAEKKGTR